MTPPSYDTSKTYSVGEPEDLYDVSIFTSDPVDCTVTYSASVSPPSTFMTETVDKRGMYWYTSDMSEVGNEYEVTVTASAGCSTTSSISYTLKIVNNCGSDTLIIDNTVFKTLPSVTLTYDIFDLALSIDWTDSIVSSTLGLLGSCGTLTWTIEMTSGASLDNTIFTEDVSGPNY